VLIKKGSKILLSLLTKMLMSLLISTNAPPLLRNLRVVPKILLSFLTNTLLSLKISEKAPLRTIL
jgi:hypothetical protein